MMCWTGPSTASAHLSPLRWALALLFATSTAAQCPDGRYQPYGSTSCVELTVCEPGTFEVRPPTATTDRFCYTARQCRSTQYEAFPPTPTTDTRCRDCSVCGAGEIEELSCSAYRDTRCVVDETGRDRPTVPSPPPGASAPGSGSTGGEEHGTNWTVAHPCGGRCEFDTVAQYCKPRGSVTPCTAFNESQPCPPARCQRIVLDGVSTCVPVEPEAEFGTPTHNSYTCADNTYSRQCDRVPHCVWDPFTVTCNRRPCATTYNSTLCASIPGCAFDSEVLFCHGVDEQIPCNRLWLESRCHDAADRCDWSDGYCNDRPQPQTGPPPCSSFDGDPTSCPSSQCYYDAAASVCIGRDDVAECRAYSSEDVCPGWNSEYAARETTAGDAVCRPLSPEGCGAEYYQAGHTPTTDRRCIRLRTCNFPRQYESIAPTATTDRACSETRQICESGDEDVGEAELQSFDPTAVSGSGSGIIDSAEENVEEDLAFYVAAPATPTSDIVCAWYTACSEGEYEQTRPTRTSNRICAPHTECNIPFEYMVHQATQTTDRICRSISNCTSDQYQIFAATQYSDRVCESIRMCEAHEFEVSPPQQVGGIFIEDRQCQIFSECSSTEYEAFGATRTSDRQCVRTTECGDGEYQQRQSTTTTDRVCQDIRVCTSNEYMTAEATATSDRACANVTANCPLDQFEDSLPTYTSDRQCRDIRNCGEEEYEVMDAVFNADGRVIRDRECARATRCNMAIEFESSPLTDSSDRVCSIFTVCGIGQIEICAPTPTSDRVCQDIWVDAGSGELSLAPTTVSPTTQNPTSFAPTTHSPTIPVPPSTQAPTVNPTTIPTSKSPTTISPTSHAPSTLAPTTFSPTSISPTSLAPTTIAPSTIAPTSPTHAPTFIPTTHAPVTLSPTTRSPSILLFAPTTISPTAISPTVSDRSHEGVDSGGSGGSGGSGDADDDALISMSYEPTTVAPTTLYPTSNAPTSMAPTTLSPTAPAPVRVGDFFFAPTTVNPTTVSPTTKAPTEFAPTSHAPSSRAPTTTAPTTLSPTTMMPTTATPTGDPPSHRPTYAPTTLAPSTWAPTVLAPTTWSPTSLAPTTVSPTYAPIECCTTTVTTSSTVSTTSTSLTTTTSFTTTSTVTSTSSATSVSSSTYSTTTSNTITSSTVSTSTRSTSTRTSTSTTSITDTSVTTATSTTISMTSITSTTTYSTTFTRTTTTSWTTYTATSITATTTTSTVTTSSISSSTLTTSTISSTDTMAALFDRGTGSNSASCNASRVRCYNDDSCASCLRYGFQHTSIAYCVRNNEVYRRAAAVCAPVCGDARVILGSPTENFSLRCYGTLLQEMDPIIGAGRLSRDCLNDELIARLLRRCPVSMQGINSDWPEALAGSTYLGDVTPMSNEETASSSSKTMSYGIYAAIAVACVTFIGALLYTRRVRKRSMAMNEKNRSVQPKESRSNYINARIDEFTSTKPGTATLEKDEMIINVEENTVSKMIISPAINETAFSNTPKTVESNESDSPQQQYADIDLLGVELDEPAVLENKTNDMGLGFDREVNLAGGSSGQPSRLSIPLSRLLQEVHFRDGTRV